MSCSNCIHFLSRGVTDASADPKQQGRADVGICRRYPPRLLDIGWDELGGATGASGFPPVHQGHSCGEYEGSELSHLLSQAGRYRRPPPEGPLC